jgi:phospholipase C
VTRRASRRTDAARDLGLIAAPRSRTRQLPLNSGVHGCVAVGAPATASTTTEDSPVPLSFAPSRPTRRKLVASTLALALGGAAMVSGGLSATATQHDSSTATPIKHLVVIFQENVSFDHYFGTYPNAAGASAAGEQTFTPKSATPTVNGLNATLLNANLNASNPKRLGYADALTCDQDHEYGDEQKAFDHGLMDKFVQTVGATGPGCDPNQVMDYYDGNVVTGLWNYAQNFAMSDNSYGTTFGPSTPGAVNLVSGQTAGVSATATPGTSSLDGEVENNTIIGDPQPLGDDCSSRDQVRLSGTNIGDLLNQKHVTWGFFQGGFKPTVPYNSTTGAPAQCGATHNVGTALGYTGQKGTKADYIPHHEPFQYYASTANPHHLPPSSVAAIGTTDQANHQYDLSDFWKSVDNGSMPAVSYLKAAGYQDGHAGYSDPIDEQHFLVDTINRLENSPDWKNTAVVISYDDSDGWYDHQMSPIVNQSQAPADQLTGPGACGSAAGEAAGLPDRCGYGPRLPLLVVSPFAKRNFVDHSISDQTSILRFVEDNWGTGQIGGGSFDAKAGSLNSMFDFANPHNGRVILDPTTGQVVDD